MRRTRNRNEIRRDQIYCTWGQHYVLPAPHIREKREEGTICLECQLRIAHELAETLGWVDMTTALAAAERKRIAADRLEKQTKSRIRAQTDGSSPGFVYYIRINGQIKIGYASDVKARMRHYPPDSELLAVEAGSMHLERQRHQDFARDLLRGREWFNESERLADHIAKTRDLNGDPAALAYEYTKPRTTRL